VEPVITGFRLEGVEYRGFLYAGLMLTGDGPKVIEFNVRFGDPEAQVVIPKIAGELTPHLIAAADGALGPEPPEFSPEKYVGVVLASSGYPGPAVLGLAISGLEETVTLDDVLVFHSGTREAMIDGERRVVTAGGRVLTVVGRGAGYVDAIARAYDAVSRLSFEGMHYRRDVGATAVSMRTSS
jgi:phosphoribosylamine--glycine ligase